ncbi:pectate lyase [bacterium]|nr:pectate lyase [bacterium]
MFGIEERFRCSAGFSHEIVGPGILRAFMVTLLILLGPGNVEAQAAPLSGPGKDEVMKTMQTATDFMMNKVSCHGAFVWAYLPDLTEQWGEVPAKRTMVWVQGATPQVGFMLLDAYEATEDTRYIGYAKRLADALVYGQLPAGGWDYYIDFDPSGIQKWYDDVLSKCWLWEEFYHYAGNCTFDDDVTAGATRYLLRLYMATIDPAYKTPLVKALDFILESQYPNGAWPQRYPLKYDFNFEGHPDYTSFYTYNDGVIFNNIYLLLEAWEKLGNEAYRNAALRGMDFVVISQMASPQAGWCDQYDTSMRPAQARSYEPAAISSSATVECIRNLENFYMITGDKRYLRGIPDALEWLENSYLPENQKTNKNVTHATFYEPGTNKPLYAHCEGSGVETGHVRIDSIPGNFMPGYGFQTIVNVQELKQEYRRVSSLTPEQAQAEYQSKKPESASHRPDPDTVQKLIQSLDDRGAWISEIEFEDFHDLVNNPHMKFRGISTGTYISNMQTLLKYIR